MARKTQIDLETQRVRFETAPDLYGLFFEDINRAADGGLYPEMIRNRAFEDSVPPAGCRISEGGEIILNDGGWPGAFLGGEGMDDWAQRTAPTKIPGWYAAHCSLRLDREDVLHPNRLAALEVRFAPGGSIRNVGYDGISVSEGAAYLFYMFAKADRDCLLHVGFVDEQGASAGMCDLSVRKSEGYERCECRLQAERDAEVRFTIAAADEVLLKIGFTSLMPEKTYLGHGLREDLVNALKNTHSRFLRFPGGCVVEGINEENALSFSRSIGPVWERPSSYLMWHYRTTNGLGYHEYLQLCEDLGIAAMYVCNCGISCQARHGQGFSRETTERYLEEALHAAEYALGGVHTKYGAMRAENGHPEPFPLVYLEIGNENFGPEYLVRYELFYQALRTAYPELKLIANVHVEREGQPAGIVDEHYYNTPEYFVENRQLFDDYDRKGPEIFVGEYAVNGGNTIASLECALAEAVFLTGMEKNQDIVRLSAYAPLFQNSRYTAWLPNLIVFNREKVYGIPSYHVISLMAAFRGKQVIASHADSETVPPVYFGIPGIMCETDALLFRNVRVNGKPAEISRKIYGDVVREGDAWRMVNGSRRHRYTGKNETWNLAFERFIGAGPEKDNPVLWMAFGEERMEECVFEAELKFASDNPVTISVWNHDPQTDAGCNEPRDTDWNLRTVRNQIWKIDGNKMMLRAPRYFDPPLREEEIHPFSPDPNAFHRYRIEAKPGQYRCYLDDELVMEKNLPELPLVSEVATMDEDRIYLKLVNIGEEVNQVRITLDCQVESEYRLLTISGRPEDVNSFEEPDRICAREEVRNGASREFVHTVPAFSVSVLVLKKVSG
ncbi:MAG: hypothetical protein IKS07_00250 [Lachnospiraceae bacterium]|nr:hypothetical protein [Lachnospiraceae bacterium]